MIRRVLLSVVMLLVIAYITMAMTVFNNKPANQACSQIELVIKDTVNAGFVTRNEIAELLQKKGLYPIGKELDRIQTKALEQEIRKHPLIDQAECYKTPSGKIRVEVSQRIPVLRVMSNNGENYYIDDKGAIMPPTAKCNAHRAIVTGKVEQAFAAQKLYKLGVFLQNNKFWNAQIEQINVLDGNRIELVPRVGDHIIYLGKIDHYEDKLSRLKIFYEKGLNKVGWNKYSRISLEFDNQIVCTKRENNTTGNN